MCGIAGFLTPADDESAIRQMVDALLHRGPDDTGFALLQCADGRPAGRFGHRRLSILDLSVASHQPMWSADRRFCLIYSGEIYNYRALRDRLEKAGMEFRTSGDTEVLLAGWMAEGASFLAKLRGMFAFAIWDSRTARAFLVRDAFGIKPLYYAATGSGLIFASEVRALLASGKIPRSISASAIRSYLNAGSVAEPTAIISGVLSVPPGCVLEIDCAGSVPAIQEPRRFASPLPVPGDPGYEARPTPTVADLRAVLRNS